MTWVKIGAAGVAVACFAATLAVPEHAATLVEVGLALLAGVGLATAAGRK